MSEFRSYIDANYETFEKELFELLRIPSVSPVSGFEKEVAQCAEVFAARMNELGIAAKVCPTAGNPVIYGETEQIPGRPTVLIYGHYDVQPEGDLANWDSDPYEPVVRNGRIYARGVGDNKGQIYSHIKGYQAYRAVYGEPKVNLKYILEGEEESGSANLAIFAEENREMLKADITIWSDANVHVSGRPIALLGLKGLASMKITVKGPCQDFHSQYSSVLPNPTWKLAKILSSLKDEKGNVLVPGFYDGCNTPGEAEMEAIRAIPGTLEDFTAGWQVNELLHGVDKISCYARYMFEPTLNCGCICAGNPAAAKNIVPYEAAAWLDIRTVPNQETADICKKIEEYICSLGIEGVSVQYSANNAAYTPLDNPFVQPALEVLREIWGEEPILYPALGGSGPYHVFNTIIGAPCIMLPYADAEQHDHGPNESLPVELYKRGIEASAALIRRFGE